MAGFDEVYSVAAPSFLAASTTRFQSAAGAALAACAMAPDENSTATAVAAASARNRARFGLNAFFKIGRAHV